MPSHCKELFLKSIGEDIELKDLTPEENDFVNKKRSLQDFDIGLKIPGKLLPKRIPGGTLLVETTYELR